MKKIILYPIVVTAIIILGIACNWCITAFLALVFQTTINDVAFSPIIVFYIVSGVATLYLSVSACQYIDEKIP